jgi:translation elongation factor EF-Tu-like GTPase
VTLAGITSTAAIDGLLIWSVRVAVACSPRSYGHRGLASAILAGITSAAAIDGLLLLSVIDGMVENARDGILLVRVVIMDPSPPMAGGIAVS